MRRREECAGSLLFRVNPDLKEDPAANPKKNDAQLQCVICGSQTQFYCVGCHHHVCGTWSKKRHALTKRGAEEKVEGQEQEFVYVDEVGPNGEKHRIAIKSTCNYLLHRQRILELAQSSLEREEADPASMNLHGRFSEATEP